MIPSTQYEEVVKWQEATDEATTVLRLRGNVPLGGIFDVRPSVKRAEIGGTLSSNELLDVASTIYAARQVKQFIEQVVEDEDLQLPIIIEHIEKLMPLPEVEQTIKMSIDENGTVLDGASDQLRGIRQKLRSTESRIREKLESLIRSSSAQKMLSDAIVTIRNERFVIPVKQEYRSAYGGIVHDQSSSGATLFIEPQAIVTLNNELQEAKVKEKQEIERILIALTVQVAEVANELRQNVYLLGELDFMFAKGRYSHELKASKPKMNDRGYIKLVKAKHPLIAQEDVVANDIELGDQYTSIVITGPNTGGKTVTLKHLGYSH